MGNGFPPEIGIFYVIKGSVYGVGDPIDEVLDSNPDFEWLDSEYRHIDYFEELTENLPELREYRGCDYGSAPRGRVLYNKATKRFAVYADECILKDGKLKKMILIEFNLVAEDVDWGYDEHYKCPNCDPELAETLRILGKLPH